MALDLRVPAERVAPPKDLELRPKQAKAWVESPSAQPERRRGPQDPGEPERHQPHESRFRRSPAAPRGLPAHRPGRLRRAGRVYGKSLLPLPAKAREALSIARELATEYSYGYKILILEKTGKLLAFGAKKQMPALVYRAMESIVQLLRASYRSYSPIPTGAWREIHQLYLHMEKDGLAAEPADAESKASIADLYTETLLIALTDPYRLVPVTSTASPNSSAPSAGP